MGFASLYPSYALRLSEDQGVSNCGNATVMIFHICLPARCEAAKSSEYRSPSFDSEGFIHCSTSDQVAEVANYLFRGQRGLVLLVINPDRVTSPIRYEDAGNGKLYPHIYAA